VSYSLETQEVSDLFRIRRSNEVATFLSQLENKAKGQWKWRPVGDRVANASNVHVLTESGPALVERITNAIDAMLELRHREVGSPEPGPLSPKRASEEWFGIKGGTLSRAKDNETINTLSPNVRVDLFDSGQPKRPTVTITDHGIGQHPNDLPLTILSLGSSNKIGRQYLCGAYGQGGSATFAWCDYTILVSRRRPQHSGDRPDLVGWTVVRRYDDIDLKLPTYQYLVTESNMIPTFSPSALAQADFEYGTYIAHISYELGRLSALWSIVGYRYLNNLLFDPVLPYTIHDHREPQPQDRYMYGSRGRLADAPVEYANEYVADLGPHGSLAIRYWVFREKKKGQEEDTGESGVSIDSYLEFAGSSRTVVVTLNGQRHAYLDKSFMKNATRYPLLSDTLLVQVECDQLSRLRKKDLFPATRSGIVAGEERLELIEKSVQQALEGDKELNRLEQERVQRRLAAVDEESEKKVKKLLDHLISISRPLVAPGAASKGGNGQVPTGPETYKPKDPPTYFRFAEEKELVRLQQGERRVVDVVTDGPNDMLTRKKRKGRLTLEALGDQVVTLHRGSLHNGRMGITVIASSDGKSGATCQLRAVLEMDGGVYFATQRALCIVPPPPPYIGQEPPTKLAIAARGNQVRLRRGATSQVTVETDCRDDLLSRPTGAGQLEVLTTIPGVVMTARRGPHRGLIEAFLHTPDGVQPNVSGFQGTMSARLILSDGTVLEDSKPCVVVEPPPPDQDRGTKKRPEANYKIIEVWREAPADQPNAMTWDDLKWDKTTVGKYDLTRDSEENELLLLYVNMDNEDLRRERERRLRTAGESSTRRLDVRYKAYIGHHLWLHSQQKPGAGKSAEGSSGDAEPNDGVAVLATSESTQEEAVLQEEMSRVAKTVILAMRSEADLFRAMDVELG